jgi:hypothetical protein
MRVFSFSLRSGSGYCATRFSFTFGSLPWFLEIFPRSSSNATQVLAVQQKRAVESAGVLAALLHLWCRSIAGAPLVVPPASSKLHCGRDRKQGDLLASLFAEEAD